MTTITFNKMYYKTIRVGMFKYNFLLKNIVLNKTLES